MVNATYSGSTEYERQWCMQSTLNPKPTTDAMQTNNPGPPRYDHNTLNSQPTWVASLRGYFTFFNLKVNSFNSLCLSLCGKMVKLVNCPSKYSWRIYLVLNEWIAPKTWKHLRLITFNQLRWPVPLSSLDWSSNRRRNSDLIWTEGVFWVNSLIDMQIVDSYGWLTPTVISYWSGWTLSGRITSQVIQLL